MDCLADRFDLLQGQFPFEDQAAKTKALQSFCFLRGPEGALGGCMHDYAVAHFQYGRVLHDEGIYAGLFECFHQLAGLGDFLGLQQRIDRRIDVHTVAVRIFAQPCDIFNGIAGRLPGTESGPCDIDGIGPAVNGCDADVRRTRGCKQFQCFHAAKIPLNLDN